MLRISRLFVFSFVVVGMLGCSAPTEEIATSQSAASGEECGASGVFTGCVAKTTVHHRYSDLLRETCGEGFDIEYTAHFDRVSEDRIFVEFIDVQYKPKDNWLFSPIAWVTGLNEQWERPDLEYSEAGGATTRWNVWRDFPRRDDFNVVLRHHVNPSWPATGDEIALACNVATELAYEPR